MKKFLLNDEIKEKSLMLQKSNKMLEEEITKNAKLQEELAQKLEMLRKNDQRFEDEAKEREELKTQLYLERKPLLKTSAVIQKRKNNGYKSGRKGNYGHFLHAVTIITTIPIIYGRCL